jgi:hypothetical protein
MPLACAQKVGRTRALSDVEQTQQELLVSLLVDNQARETWRKQPRRVPACVPAPSNAPFTPEREEAAATQSKRPILSFSSSFGIHCSIDESAAAQGQDGLLFDTSGAM